MPRDEPITITFTGEESDRFVRFAEKLADYGHVPYVTIHGREPLTRTEIVIEGKVENTVFDRYIRYVTVVDRDGQSYNVGGSNATESISAAAVKYTQVPAELGGVKLTSEEVRVTLAQLIEGSFNRAYLLVQLKTNLAGLDRSLIDNIVDAVLRYAIHDPNVETRREVVDLLANIGSISIVVPLLTLFQDSSPLVRRDVALRLRGLERKIRDAGHKTLEQSVNALMDCLDDENAYVRTYAAEDLGYIWDSAFASRTVEALVARLQSDPDEHVRWATAIALGRINDSSVISPLLDAAQNDSFFRVCQSALLGLGRRAKEAGGQYPNLASVLSKILKDSSFSVRGYAAFALGQLGENAKGLIPLLVDALLPQIDVGVDLKYVEHIRSNATLALGLLSDWIEPQDRDRLKHNLRSALSAESEYSEGSPYLTWFLTYGVELITSLESHDLAHLFYSRLSERYADWRRMYYSAAGLYESAEQLCLEGDAETAYDVLLKARQTILDCHGYPQDAEAGIAFQAGMVNARISILEAVFEWEDVVGGNFTRCKQKFETARRIYSSFRVRDDDGRKSDWGDEVSLKKRLTQREEDFIYGLRSIAQYGATMIDMEEAIRNESDVAKAIALVATVQEDIEALLARLAKSKTTYLVPMVKQLQRTLKIVFDEVTERQATPVEQVRSILRAARQVRAVYKQSAIPMPATACPIVGLGKAEVEFRVAGAISGSGDQYEPYLFPCDARLIVEADVRVIERIRADDELVFFFRDQDKVIEQLVPVYDQGWQIPVDLGTDDPAFTAFPYDVWLEFRGKDCNQVVFQQKVWIQRYDPEKGFLFPAFSERDLSGQSGQLMSSVWVAVVQLLGTETQTDAQLYLREMYVGEYLRRGVFVLRQSVHQHIRDTFVRVLHNIKEVQPDVQLVLFPELSIPWAIRDEIRAWSSELQIHIVVGFEHCQDPITYHWQNLVQIFAPSQEVWTQVKNLPAKVTVGNQQMVEGIQERSPRVFNRICTAFGDLIVLVCSEAVSGTTFELGLALQQQARPDIIMIPSMSPVVYDFYGWADAYLRKLYCGVLFANHAHFGYSAIFTPKKEELREVQEARRLIAHNSRKVLERTENNHNGGRRILLPMVEGFVLREIEIVRIREIRDGKTFDRAYLSPPS